MTAHQVVVGVDGSPLSLEALGWAVEEARLRRTGVRVVHAWRSPIRFPAPQADDPMIHEAEALDRAAVHEAVSSVIDPSLVEVVFVRGPAAPALLLEAENSGLLVVGSRGHGGLAGLLLGSVSQHCAQRAHCPVAIVRPIEGHVDPRIVVGIDGSAAGEKAARWALEQARLHGARLDLMSAWHPVWAGPHQTVDLVSQLVEQQAREAVERVLDKSEAGSVPITRMAIEDRPALALVEAAKGASLLVVGSRGLGGFESLLLGSVSQSCAHLAPCPVVIVP